VLSNLIEVPMVRVGGEAGDLAVKRRLLGLPALLFLVLQVALQLLKLLL